MASTVKGPSPRARAAADKAAFDSAMAAAQEALRAQDVPGMFEALDRPELEGSAGAPMRYSLWRELVARRVPPELQGRFLAGLREEDESSAHAIGYRLYIQKELAPRVLEELARALEAGARGRLDAARLCSAVREWPDFPFPEGFLAGQEAYVRRALDPRPQEHPDVRAADVTRSVEQFLGGLERGSLAGLRGVRDRAPKVDMSARARVLGPLRERLESAAKEGEVMTRAAAIEVLDLLDVPAVELAPLTAGLPAAAGVRAIRQRARPSALPVLTLVADRAPRAPARDMSKVMGAARYPFGQLLTTRREATFEADGKRRWSFKAHGDPLQPVRVLANASAADRELVFITSKHGLHCLDGATGKELWCNRTATHPSRFGAAVLDPFSYIWALADRLWLVGSREVQALSWDSGALLDAVALLEPDTRGLLPVEDGVMIVDGPTVLNTFGCHDQVPSGLVLHRDGTTTDRVFPAPLAGMVRARDGITVEVSAVDVQVGSGAQARCHGLPFADGERLEAVGQLFRSPSGALCLELGIHEQNHFGVHHWIAVEIPGA